MNCVICNKQLSNKISLGHMPIANNFLSIEDLYKEEIYYPLDLYFCNWCCFLQQKVYEKPENIFNENYHYYSSYSSSWLKHCKDYAKMIIKERKLNKDSFVIEVASNDGYLLQYFKNIPYVGIEPAKNVAKMAIYNGINTDISFFNQEYVKNIRKADLIICNNVLAHVPDINDFVMSLKSALKEDGIITIEVPHLLELIKNNQFDTIYHEHFYYYSVMALHSLFNNYDLQIYKIEKLKTHGGSLRLYIKHKYLQMNSVIERMIDEERKYGLYVFDTYERFLVKANQVKKDLISTLIALKNAGYIITGYGAPAKGNTLLNFCGIKSDIISFVVDDNPIKQNKFLPGSHIAIKSPEEIERHHAVLILPWNIKEELMKKVKAKMYIISIPEVKIYD